MSGEQQRHELVAHLIVGHSTALVVASQEHLREDVAALREVGGVTPTPDFCGERCVERIACTQEPRPRCVGPEPPIACCKEQEGIPAEAGELDDVTAQVIMACAPI